MEDCQRMSHTSLQCNTASTAIPVDTMLQEKTWKKGKNIFPISSWIQTLPVAQSAG